MKRLITFFLILSTISFTYNITRACTSLLVTKGASADGSTMITYTCDGEFHPHLGYEPAKDYPEGDSLAIENWGGEVRGYIKQVPHTYAVIELMNEHQLAISETTFDGREELRNKEGLLHYWDLISLALQRAKTARGAIEVMTGLVEEYGYLSSGESFSIADPEECWILEMIGPGEGGNSAYWVAVKIPDGYISAHANKARIGTFPLDDPENCLYSKDVITFAIEKGYYNPEIGEPFRYNEAYCPSNARNQRWADGRVWSIFRRSAPSLNISSDYYRAVPGSKPYPLWIKPDEKISVHDVFDLMRDHFEGTPYDMTKGVDAGPFGNPIRNRPLFFDPDTTTDGEYMWERPISTQQTAYSFVSQSRSSLPDPIGGVLWYGVDDTYSTCYFPLYCGINDIPKAYAEGSLGQFSWESAWWVFNIVANYANLRYSDMIEDIQVVQSELENKFLMLQPAVEKSTLDLYETDQELMTKYLTDYSIAGGDLVYDRWIALAEFLFTKYNDGYVKDENGRAKGIAYPEDWLDEVVKSRPGQFDLPITVDSTGIKLVD